MDFTLQNSDGRFADNPTSPYYPRWAEWVEVRYSVTKGVTYQRFYGYVVGMQPDVADGEMTRHVVRVSCVDVLGRLARRVSRCDFSERWLNRAQTSTVDLFPFDPAATPTTLANVGSGTGTATIVRPTSGVGSVTADAPDESTVNLDGAITVTPTSLVGPTIDIRTSIASGSVNDIVIPFRTADRTVTGSIDKWLMFGRDVAGVVLWSVRLADSAGACNLNLYDSSGTLLSTLYAGFAPVNGGTDDQWFALRMSYSGGTVVTLRRSIDAVQVGAVGVAFDSRLTQVIVLGGALPWRTPGKQTACTAASFGTVAVSSSLGGYADYLQPLVTEPAQTRFVDGNLYYDFGSAQNGTRSRTVALKRLTGRSAFDIIDELARTAGALVIASRASNNGLLWYDADVLRSSTVVVTLDAIADIDASAGWAFRRGVDTKPTRVTATWPGGQTTYIGDESVRGQFDASVDTCAADEQGARDVAASLVNGPVRSSLVQVGVDLATSETDLWASVMGLRLEERLRVTSLPSNHYGATYLDVYVVGHVEEYGQLYARHTFDTTPADDPVNGQFGSGLYSKFGASAGGITVTSGTAVGSTGTGTIVATTTIGQPFTVAAGAYPMTLDWNGEHVTITSAPASSTSPQTLTITARAVNGTVARSHVAGESLDVALPLAFAR
jgi:hypothetical protein